MLFTTAAFTFLYLPVVVIAFYVIGRHSHRWAAGWLFAASVFFYGFWAPEFTLLLLVSILVNFSIGKKIAASKDAARSRQRSWLVTGVTFNLCLLAYFKYANFFVDTAETILGTQWGLPRIVLPIGISFFTFTQIAFLADAYQKGVRELNFPHYGLFVTYFPHLVAGPVLHHAQMMPQFSKADTYRFNIGNFSAGAAIFALGLVKKVVVADGISPYADAVFNSAGPGHNIAFAEAWLGTLAYTFQLYFDFSGYSDMAIGLALLLNVNMPFNFNSPYKALNISDFWRRWHMTLSAFLRDYLYYPLGGNRRGPMRRYANLATTMILGGLWHGASWTFVFWGVLHGLYLGINHAFRAATARIRPALETNVSFGVASWLMTFVATVVAWVFFRANSFDAAAAMLRGMFSWPSGFASPATYPALWNAGLDPARGVTITAVLAVVAFLAPNSNVIGGKIRSAHTASPRNCALTTGAALTLIVLLVIVNETRESVSAFIYFNF